MDPMMGANLLGGLAGGSGQSRLYVPNTPDDMSMDAKGGMPGDLSPGAQNVDFDSWFPKDRAGMQRKLEMLQEKIAELKNKMYAAIQQCHGGNVGQCSQAEIMNMRISDYTQQMADLEKAIADQPMTPVSASSRRGDMSGEPYNRPDLVSFAQGGGSGPPSFPPMSPHRTRYDPSVFGP